MTENVTPLPASLSASRPALPFVPLALVALVLLTSASLFRARQTVATLQQDIDRSVQSFVFGTPLPPLPVLDHSVSAPAERTLSSYCAAGKFLLAVFRPAHCPRCEALDARYRALVTERTDVTVVAISLRDSTGTMDPQPRGVVSAMTTPAALAGVLHVSKLPAAVAADGHCREFAAGAGLRSTEAVIAQFAPAAP